MQTDGNRLRNENNMVIQMASPTSLPFDVEKDLNGYNKVYITKQFNLFRTFHCCEFLGGDYIVYGLLPDGDKKILFTAKKHYKCCDFCNDCVINCCLCQYVCCNKILYQMDYQRNNLNFYTQGVNLVKGCYFCNCSLCCRFCGVGSILFLRENISPDDPDIRVGKQKGQTIKQGCLFCQDRVIKYIDERGVEGHTLRLKAFDVFLNSIPCSCTRCQDIEISIENANGVKTGSICVPNGCCSTKVEDICHIPGAYFEVNFPPNISSAQKFQIIAEAVHFNCSIPII